MENRRTLTLRRSHTTLRQAACVRRALLSAPLRLLPRRFMDSWSNTGLHLARLASRRGLSTPSGSRKGARACGRWRKYVAFLYEVFPRISCYLSLSLFSSLSLSYLYSVLCYILAVITTGNNTSTRIQVHYQSTRRTSS